MNPNLTDAVELVRSWKSADADRVEGEHPAGQIRLRTPRRLGRRADLLASSVRGHVGFTDLIATVTTVSVPGTAC